MGGVLGVIGGSGIYALDRLEAVTRRRVTTPYGPPSDDVVCGRLGETELLFLARHGAGHPLPPHAVNYRANICALKRLGATHLLSLSAVGSMKEQIAPGHVVIVDQFIDLTKRRASTFFDDGLAAHVSFAQPVCGELAGSAARAAERAGASVVHGSGTYVCIEGPQFSTLAESRLYRSWGVDVIGMTAMPEAKLAREAELPYATVALVTDYDCWHETEAAVSVESVLAVLRKNADLARRIVLELARELPDPKLSAAARALEYAIITAPEAMTADAKHRLEWLIDSRFEREQS